MANREWSDSICSGRCSYETQGKHEAVPQDDFWDLEGITETDQVDYQGFNWADCILMA